MTRRAVSFSRSHEAELIRDITKKAAFALDVREGNQPYFDRIVARAPNSALKLEAAIKIGKARYRIDHTRFVTTVAAVSRILTENYESGNEQTAEHKASLSGLHWIEQRAKAGKGTVVFSKDVWAAMRSLVEGAKVCL